MQRFQSYLANRPNLFFFGTNLGQMFGNNSVIEHLVLYIENIADQPDLFSSLIAFTFTS